MLSFYFHTKMIPYILSLLELGNIIAHIMVLLEIKIFLDFEKLSPFTKFIYFPYELTTSVTSFMYLCIYSSTLSPYYCLFIYIHYCIHMAATVFHYTPFFAKIFMIANGRIKYGSDIPLWLYVIYFLGTLEDILTHSMNVYYLWFILS
jgi:hypothetical protein